jgi:hypothetical protein
MKKPTMGLVLAALLSCLGVSTAQADGAFARVMTSEGQIIGESPIATVGGVDVSTLLQLDNWSIEVGVGPQGKHEYAPATFVVPSGSHSRALFAAYAQDDADIVIEVILFRPTFESATTERYQTVVLEGARLVRQKQRTHTAPSGAKVHVDELTFTFERVTVISDSNGQVASDSL